MSDEALRRVVYIRSGYSLSEEEGELLRKSPLPIGEWVGQRAQIAGVIQEKSYVVDGKTGTVEGFDDTDNGASAEARGKLGRG